MKTKDNIFLTGQAGTGKTYTINNYIKWATDEGLNVVLTASTGVAAINISGMTIHAFLGSRISNSIEEYKTLKIRPSYWQEIKDSIIDMDVLIVDEVSMLSADYINLIDYILKKATNSNKAFGGKKIIFTGDFLQLPPITKNNRTFAFESRAWKEANFKIINLTKIYRQTDKEFGEMLSRVRMGDSSDEVFDFFDSLNCNDVDWNDNSVKLFARNNKVSEYNMSELDLIDKEPTRYYADTWGKTPQEEEKMIKNIIADEVLELKLDARVIALKNAQDFSYVNGSLGTVIKLNENSVKVKFDNGYVGSMTKEKWEVVDKSGTIISSFEQIPLKLAYALTIHKSQGMSINKLTIDCTDIFEEGQFYVAVSRATNKEDLKLIGFKEKHIRPNSKAVDFYSNFKS